MDDLQITERTINIEQVFREKSEATARWIPGFVFAWLRRIIHEKKINEFLYAHRDVIGLDFVEALIREFGVRLEVEGLEHIPRQGKALVAANHPLGGLDGIALMHVTGGIRPDIVFPVNDLLLFLPNLKPLFIPINKHGSNTDNIRIIHETFASDRLMLFFPAGLVSRRQNGVIADLEWKTTFITKARKYQRDIIPTFIEGRNSSFFYTLANLRKRIGIKANIEMLFLPDEMFKQYNKTIRIIFGPPVPWQTFDKRYTPAVWALKIREYVYSMREGEIKPFDPES